MVAPSGEQHEIEGHGYRAVVTESGATLRVLEYDGRPLVDSFPEDAMATGGSGQLLAPWPNRLRDGAYTAGGRRHQLPLSEPARHNASHGLVRWVSWTLRDRTESALRLGYRLMAQPGYPWTLDLAATFSLGPGGLAVTTTVLNRAAEPAPFALGAHPYLSLGRPVDELELTLPAATRLLTDDERKLPVRTEPVAGTDVDARAPRIIGPTMLDHAFTDLEPDAAGLVTVTLREPVSGSGVALWVGPGFRWLQVYSGDDLPPERRRRSLAVEPMSAPPDAFNSGTDLALVRPEEELTFTWGIAALG